LIETLTSRDSPRLLHNTTTLSNHHRRFLVALPDPLELLQFVSSCGGVLAFPGATSCSTNSTIHLQRAIRNPSFAGPVMSTPESESSLLTPIGKILLFLSLPLFRTTLIHMPIDHARVGIARRRWFEHLIEAINQDVVALNLRTIESS
jgi:hypothetical protein